MAGPIPDARALSSWQDAFQHPLPVVRKLEQQLRRNIDDNRQKLRTLVGASYRELLGTAERIIEMDDRMQTIETYLGDIGKNCNARTVEKIAENYTRMQGGGEGYAQQGTGVRRGVMVEARVLQACLTAGMRVVKARGDALQAAKLFVLSRLLHKSLADGERPPGVLEDLRRRLQALRSRLLAYVERDVARLSTDSARLAHTLCAYVLVTSSTPKDALRHFLQIRYDQLDRKIDAPSEKDVLQLLELYHRTLLDTRELFPRRLANVLSQLSHRPLWQDEQVAALSELNLDIYSSWVADDIRTFTPFVRHDQLVASETMDALTAWAKQAQACLLERLNDFLEVQTDVRDILESRRRFIARLLQLSSSRVDNFTPAAHVQDVRLAFLSRLTALARQAARIDDLTIDDTRISAATADSNVSNTWSLASENFELKDGAIKLRRSILAARHGRDDLLADEIRKLDEWTKRVHEILDMADDMTATKWDEDLDVDWEDLEGGESLRQTLKRHDAEQLRTVLRESIQNPVHGISHRIEAQCDTTKNPAFYMRLWRKVGLRRGALDTRLGLSIEPVSLVGLYRNIGSRVVQRVVPAFGRAAKRRRPAATSLWDGSPALPVQCSPATFRFLTQLQQAMTGVGADLWTAPCVWELKELLLAALSRELDDPAFLHPVQRGEGVKALTNGHAGGEELPTGPGLDSSANGEENDGKEEGDEDESSKQDVEPSTAVKSVTTELQLSREQLVQNVFDAHYLSLYVLRRAGGKGGVSSSSSVSEGSTDSLDALTTTMTRTLQLDAGADARLRKNAGEFWRKTYLLFGLLAPEGGER